MKETPHLKQAHANMLPGVITADGFLGTDPRTLMDILIADEAEIQRLGVTHEALADRMEELRDRGAAGLGLPETVEPHFEVLVEGVRGGLPCPFGCAGLIHKTNTTVTDTRSGESITYTDLSIHLIHSHGFYQGLGAPFRLDPQRLARLLEVAPLPVDPTRVPGLPPPKAER